MSSDAHCSSSGGERSEKSASGGFHFWRFDHDKEHFEFRDGIDSVRNVGRENKGIAGLQGVITIADTDPGFSFDDRYEGVVWGFVFAEAFAVVKCEECDRPAGILQQDAADDGSFLIFERGREVYDIAVVHRSNLPRLSAIALLCGFANLVVPFPSRLKP